MSDWAVIGVPLYTLAAYDGMGAAPSALRKAGIKKSFGVVHDMGDVEIPRLRKDKLEGLMKNFNHFKDANAKVYQAVGSTSGDSAVVIGGECSVAVGAIPAFAKRFGGRPGMLWLDAHGDFNTPTTSPSGYIGGMCLAMACGRTPDVDLNVGAPPVLGEERLVHVGSRALDKPEIEAFNSSPARLYTAQQVKRTGAADVAEESARHLENRSDWIACHLDIDVVDPSFIPAVNYPTPGGLTLDEAAMVMRALVKTGKLRVLEVAAYNASRDRRGASAKAVVALLNSAFA